MKRVISHRFWSFVLPNMNVVSLLDRLQANASKLAGEQEALMADYQPDVKDIRTFLKVLRHLQKRSANEQSAIVLRDDLLELKITELLDNDLNVEHTSFTDHTEVTRSVSFNLPWWVFDLDESEISKDSEGIDAIDHFSRSVLNWMDTLKINRS